jgi:hypothetical protein
VHLISAGERNYWVSLPYFSTCARSALQVVLNKGARCYAVQREHCMRALIRK